MAKDNPRLTAAAERARLQFIKESVELEGVELEMADEKLRNMEKANKLMADNSGLTEEILGGAADIEKKMLGFIKGIPIIGGRLEKNVKAKLDKVGKSLEDRVFKSLQKSVMAEKSFSKGLMRLAMKNPFTALAAAAIGLFILIKKIRGAARDLGQDLNVSTKQAMKMLPGLKMQEMKFKAIGLDATKIKTALGAISDEFGSLENVTAKNAANVSRMAQNLGLTGKEIVQFNKVMMDLTGASFDTASNMAQVAADMAKAANVGTGKVLSDMASNAENFARFSMDGAEGMAKAAVEAAKIGGSLSEVIKVADKLLDFETSITAQFKAQVLTGKNLNLERARQLSLEGDIAGLTAEVQSIIGGLGSLQSMNVIERQSIADALGLTVGELQRISAGEAIQQESEEVKIARESNQYLREIAGHTGETANKGNEVEVIQSVF